MAASSQQAADNISEVSKAVHDIAKSTSELAQGANEVAQNAINVAAKVSMVAGKAAAISNDAGDITRSILQIRSVVEETGKSNIEMADLMKELKDLRWETHFDAGLTERR